MLEHPLMVCKDELLPHPKGVGVEEEESLLILIQVTQFKCGGFVVGIRNSHAISDGPGAAQFMSAVGEMTRDFKRPTVEPIWSRDVIPNPPKFIAGPPAVPTDIHLTSLVLDVPAHFVSSIKSQFFDATGDRCSTFDALIAKSWQTRTRIINFGPEVDVHLCFSMNTRKLVLQPHQNGYYGNCYYIVKVSANSEFIKNSRIVDVVKLIRDAKKGMPTEYSRWARGKLAEDPYRLTSSHETLLVSDWSHLGFSDVDYGWGKLLHMVPMVNFDYISTAIIVKPSSSEFSARLMTQCVTEAQVVEFRNGVMKLD